MGKRDIYIPFYVGDFVADTMDFSAQETGAYMLLICHYWRNKGPIPYDFKALSRVCKLSSRDTKFVLVKCLSKFQLLDGKLYHSRIDAEIKKLNEKIDKCAESGRLGGLRKAKNNLANAKISLENNCSESLPYQSHNHNKILPKKEVKEKQEKENPSPIVEGHVYFRMSNEQELLVQEYCNKKGIDLKFIPQAIEIVENWLAEGGSPKARQARKAPTHYRRLKSFGLTEAIKQSRVITGHGQFKRAIDLQDELLIKNMLRNNHEPSGNNGIIDVFSGNLPIAKGKSERH